MTRTKTDGIRRLPPKGKKTGPKSKCTPEVIQETEALCKVGLTDWQLALYFNVNEDSITYWKKTIPEFKAALKRGRTEADVRVAEALYQRALGYNHDAIQFFKDTVTEKEYDENGNITKERSYGRIIKQPYVKHYPPDVKAATKILAVRHRDTWGESWKSQKTHIHSVSGEINHRHAQDQDYLKNLKAFSTEELELLSKLGLNKRLEIPETASNP